MDHDAYKAELRQLQLALVHVQRHMIETGQSAVIVIEGRDAAGKGGVIRRITEYVAPRRTRVVALDKPSDRERRSWYFQRYISHMPAAGELVLFDRSWYNRAGVERVMGYSSAEEREAFFHQVDKFESMLVSAGTRLEKYYLDVSRRAQAERIEARQSDPLKSWKLSEIDRVAVDRYDDYTEARDEMLMRSSHPVAPWRVVRADDKYAARIHLFRDLLQRLPRPDNAPACAHPDPGLVTEFSPALLQTDHLAR